MEEKICTRCKQSKIREQFPNDKSKSDGLFSWCKQCKKESKQKDKDKISAYNKEYKSSHKTEVSESRRSYYEAHKEEAKSDRKKYYQDHHEEELKTMEFYRRERGMKPASENKDCSLFLGTYITEQSVKPIIPNAERMPHGHPKYDYLCSKGYKIDVKSATMYYYNKKGTYRWSFKINHNTEADYFMCVAYNDRDDLNIIKIWMIPGNIINHLGHLSISPGSFEKWKEYEIDPTEATICVDKLTKNV